MVPYLHSSKYLAIVLAAVGVAIVIFSLATPTTHSGGMGSESTNYQLSNLLLGIVGAFIAAIGLSYFFLKEEYQPYAATSFAFNESVEASTESKGRVVSQTAKLETSAPEPINVQEGELILRLLTGDERLMFKAILDSGGQALQKDLILKTKMSDAKVSRTIDRLVEKDLIVKERYGVTNRVRIVIEK
jgi:hypothetical protein